MILESPHTTRQKQNTQYDSLRKCMGLILDAPLTRPILKPISRQTCFPSMAHILIYVTFLLTTQRYTTSPASNRFHPNHAGLAMARTIPYRRQTLTENTSLSVTPGGRNVPSSSPNYASTLLRLLSKTSRYGSVR